MRSDTAPLVTLISMHKLAVSPELLVTGHADEILVKVMGSRLAGQGTYKDFVPQDNHSQIYQLSVLLTRLMAWAVSTAHANPPAVMQDSCRQTLDTFQLEFSAVLLIVIFLSTR